MEVWKDISGYEGLYQVSNTGRVKSLARNTIGATGRVYTLETKILSQSIDKYGYCKVTLCNQGTKMFSIHRLVAVAFIENKAIKPQVNHIDGNKQNNNVSNLEWATISENIKHAFDTGLKKPLKGESHPHYGKRGKCASKSKVVFDTETGVFYESATEAAEIFGLKTETLGAMLRGVNRNKTNLIYA